MPLTPGYGDDELHALVPNVRELLGETVGKAAVYDLQQAVQEEVAEELLTPVLAGTLVLEDLLSDSANK